MNIEIKENPNIVSDDLDARVRNKIKLLSKKLLYIAYMKIKSGDMSSAISYLNNAVKLDKNNYHAHNLLGLAYHNVGEIPLAIRHWVISQNVRSSDNKATYYLEQVRENKAKLNDYNESFKKYNKSLQHARAGSADLSIVNLKKAISINPRFVKARLLLALCYVKEGKEQYAVRELNKLLKIDSGNLPAKSYLATLSSEETENSESVKVNKANANMAPKTVRRSKTSPINKFIYVLSGIVLGALVVYLALVPSIKKDLNSQIGEKELAIEKLKDKVDGLNASLNTKDNDIASLDAELKNKANVLSENKLKLAETEKLSNVLRNYYIAPADTTKAGNILVNIDEDILSDELKEFTISMKTSVLPVLAEQVYVSGYNAYLRGEFDKAIEFFDTSYSFKKDGYPAENALYYKGRAYLKKGDLPRMTETFEQLINDYPNSTLVPDAKYFLERD